MASASPHGVIASGGPSGRPDYLPHVDGLRALAVAAVVLYHLDPGWLPGGFVGVDLFFVISGFVVSASVDRLPALSSGAELLRFYARRMRRILPALVACLLATWLLSMLFIPQSWLSEASEKTGRMALVGLSNWVLAGTGNDYFSPRAEFNPFTHTWSLGVEEQFYLLFPALFLLWRRGGIGRQASLLMFALAVSGSLAWALLQARTPGQEAATFYLTTTRFWQIGAGVLLYQLLALLRVRDGRSLFEAGVTLPAPLRMLLALLGLGCIGVGMLQARAGHAPWPDGAWPVLGALILIAALHRHPHDWVGRALSARPLVALGLCSYSLYLWHWPVLVLLRWTVGLDSLAVKLVALALSVALAIASWRWIETPWRHRRSPVSDGRVVLRGFGVLLLAFAAQAVIDKASAHLSLNTVTRHPLDWYAYARGLKKEFPQCRQGSPVESLDGLSVRTYARGECSLPEGSARNIFVIGDSHALAYNELFRRHVLLDGGQVRLYGVGGCAVADMQSWAGVSPACAGFVQAAIGDVAARAAPGDVLFLPGLRLPRLVDQDVAFDHAANVAAMQADEAVQGRARLADEVVTQLQPLAGQGIRIVFEAPKPLMQAPPYRCSNWFDRGNAICAPGMTIGRQAMEDYRAPARQALVDIVARLPHASLWDPLPLLCGTDVCEPLRDGRPLFFDADHLSGHGNRVLLPAFQAHLQSLDAQQ